MGELHDQLDELGRLAVAVAAEEELVEVRDDLEALTDDEEDGDADEDSAEVALRGRRRLGLVAGVGKNLENQEELIGEGLMFVIAWRTRDAVSYCYTRT